MMNKLSLPILLSMILIISGCKDNEPINLAAWNSDVSIYLLDEYDTEEGSLQIDESSIRLANQPLIRYRDIEHYNAVNFTFLLSDLGKSELENLPDDGHHMPFALVADDKVMYTGYFWASYSSGSCDWVTADPVTARFSGELHIRLGYPGASPSWNIPDRRNDPRMLKILAGDDKLLL